MEEPGKLKLFVPQGSKIKLKLDEFDEFFATEAAPCRGGPLRSRFVILCFQVREQNERPVTLGTHGKYVAREFSGGHAKSGFFQETGGDEAPRKQGKIRD